MMQAIPVHVSSNSSHGLRSPRSGEILYRSPGKILHQAVLRETTDYVIIGDSVIKAVNPGKMNTGQYSHVQKISVPGMTTTDLSSWLDSQSPNTHVSRLVFHVGVNDCKGGTEVTAEHWTQLLSKMKVVFPSALTIASAIIPARGRHLMNPTISSSNQNLHTVCSHLHIKFVNHRSTFITKSGAPRKDLYENALHPSIKGTLKLARNIKYPDHDFSVPLDHGASDLTQDGRRNGNTSASVNNGQHHEAGRSPASALRLQQDVVTPYDVTCQQQHSGQQSSTRQVGMEGGNQPTGGNVSPSVPYHLLAQPPVITPPPQYQVPVSYPVSNPASTLQSPPVPANALDAVTQALRLLQGIFPPAQ